ncbi:MAG: N-acetylglucosamine-6-phosphate deacetylase [Caldicoprobacterales bacterium]|jgi:N-acetylglucosamine-6-phosphate deacetylase
MKAIVNAVLVRTNHLIEDGVLVFDEGRIIDYGSSDRVKLPDNCEIIDAQGSYVGPGLIDIHTHAGGSTWFYEDPVKAARENLLHGTTSVLPTLYFNTPKEQLLDQIQFVKEKSTQDEGRIIRGLYMEAPYLNPKFGADRENNPWNRRVDVKDYAPLIEAAGDFAKVWCLAPELENIEGFVKDVKAAIPNIVFSVAHSEASPAQIERLMPYGLRLATHHTNATGDLVKYPEVRGVCVDETVNYNDDIYAELICDRKGIHVDPYMLRLVVKIKGKARIILVSDACVFDGPVPEGYEGATDINFDWQGEIAGSKLTLDLACHNMMVHTGASLCDVFNYASTNPARLLGFTTKGKIEKGFDADLIMVDDKMNVKTVILDGNRIK